VPGWPVLQRSSVPSQPVSPASSALPWTADSVDGNVARFDTGRELSFRALFGVPGVFLEVVDKKRLVFTDAFRPGWRPSGRPFMAAEVVFEDAGDGKTRYIGRAMHWTAEARKEHEEMGFHEGWGKAADQLEALARTL
jgi:uncharacterized protein YndB with AHSA1/START domain